MSINQVLEIKDRFTFLNELYRLSHAEYWQVIGKLQDHPEIWASQDRTRLQQIIGN